MNILHLVPALESGGVERGTVDLALALKKFGHNIIVISSGGRMVKYLEDGGVSHVRLPLHKKSPLTFFLIPRIAKVIRDNKTDIVHASSRVPAWVGFFASRMAGTRFVTSCHGFYSKHFFSSIMARGELVMVISRAIGKRMSGAFGVPEKKIRLVYRGVDLKRFPFKADKYDEDKKSYVILNIGRLTPLKGQYEFIKAMRYVREKFGNAEAWIAGGAEKGKEAYSERLRGLAEKMKLKKCVKFLGLREDTPDLLEKADLLVLSTNVQEGFGRTVIEAGAAGCACCASAVGGIKEVIEDGVSGLLFPPHDEIKMASAIKKMLDDAALRKKCARGLRKKVEENFTLEKMANQTLAVYREILGTE